MFIGGYFEPISFEISGKLTAAFLEDYTWEIVLVFAIRTLIIEQKCVLILNKKLFPILYAWSRLPARIVTLVAAASATRQAVGTAS